MMCLKASSTFALQNAHDEVVVASLSLNDGLVVAVELVVDDTHFLLREVVAAVMVVHLDAAILAVAMLASVHHGNRARVRISLWAVLILDEEGDVAWRICLSATFSEILGSTALSCRRDSTALYLQVRREHLDRRRSSVGEVARFGVAHGCHFELCLLSRRCRVRRLRCDRNEVNLVSLDSRWHELLPSPRYSFPPVVPYISEFSS